MQDRMIPLPKRPKEMDDQHLANSLKYSERRVRALRREQERRVKFATHPFFVAERERC